MSEIKVFGGTTTDFTTGGVILNPISAQVTEEANGAYQLTLVCVRDDSYGRHKLLKTGEIICCDVPSKKAPMRHVQTSTGIVTRYTAVGKKRVSQSKTVIFDGIYTQTRYTVEWSNYMLIHGVDKLTAMQRVHDIRAKKIGAYEYGDIKCYKTAALKDQLAVVHHGQPINAIDATSTYVFGVTSKGYAGYFKKEQVRLVGTIEGDIWEIVDDESTVGTYQPFRIVSVDHMDGKSVRVTARHIYFDASAKQLDKQKIDRNVSLSLFCDQLNENGIIRFHAGTDAYVDIDGDNAVQRASNACEGADLQLVRDGFDAYFLPPETTEQSVEIRTGYNCKKLTIRESTDELVTRWVPVIKDEAKQPIDSEHIADYPIVYEQRLEVESVQQAQEEAKRAMKEGADLPRLEITVECAIGTIDNVSVFDVGRIDDDLLDDHFSARINSITFDAMRNHVTKIALGKAQSRISAVFTAVSGSWQNIN